MGEDPELRPVWRGDVLQENTTVEHMVSKVDVASGRGPSIEAVRQARNMVQGNSFVPGKFS